MKTKAFLDSILGAAVLLLGATFAPTSFGQAGAQDQSAPASQPAPKMHDKGEGRFAALNLTEDQRAQIKKIHENAKAEAEAVMSDSSLSDPQKQAKVKQIHHAAMKRAHAVLTPDQREQLKASRRERRSERSQPRSM